MRPEQPLTIFELRARDEAAKEIFENPANLDLLGPALAGLHWEADFAFVFFQGEPGPAPAEFLAARPNLILNHIHHLTYDQWQDGAGALPFTAAGLLITGPDVAGPEPRLLIDPGLAFGFGGHPTTRACLDCLALALQTPPRPSSALDLGAGTGILALAAARLGVPRVTGVDYSHLAVAAALNNRSLNGLEGQVKFHRAPAQLFHDHPGELLLANLHLSLQEELLDLGAFHRRQKVIVSGLLPSEGERLWNRLAQLGFKLADQIRTDRWITLYGVKK
jgi:ribosomal protein L11 methyltransferase